MRSLLLFFALYFLIGCSSIPSQQITTKGPLTTESKSQKNLTSIKIQDRKTEDRLAYNALMSNLAKKEDIGISKQIRLFEGPFASSDYADNAFFFVGRYFLEKEDYGLALKYFNHVISHYPNTNKAVSALYLKSQTLNKLGLRKLANQPLTTLQKQFPGSPESQKAAAEFRATAEIQAVK